MEWIRIVWPDWLRILLLAGLLAHKLTWEVLKRKGASPVSRTKARAGVLLRLVKLAKIGFLLALLIQTAILEVLPISANPMALRLLGIVVFLMGLMLAIGARVTLGENWSDIEDSRVLPEQRVVDRGIYRFIRHPIYVGDLLLVTGLQLALNSWLVLGVILLAPIVLRQAVAEEKLLAGAFPDYARYCMRTKRFIPFVV